MSYFFKRKNLAILILAAGRSKRMGENNKILLKLKTSFMINIIIEKFMKLGFKKIYVVLGHQSTKIKRYLKKKKVIIVKNKSYNLGQSSSIRVGISAIEKTSDNILIALGDMPFISLKLIDNLSKKHLREKNHLDKITLPKHNKIYRNPVIWGKNFYPKLKNLNNDQGAKFLLKDNCKSINEVNWKEEGEFFDIDTRKDFHFIHNYRGKYL